MSDPKRYNFSPFLQVFSHYKAEAAVQFYVEDDGKWVAYEDYAKVKESGREILQHLRESTAEVERLKAEVERLNSVDYMITASASCGKSVIPELLQIEQLKKEVQGLTKMIQSSNYYFLSLKLHEKVQRMTKAGDDLCESLFPDDFANEVKDEDKPLWAAECALAKAWNEAKQSE
jgi:hypothetical protein